MMNSKMKYSAGVAALLIVGLLCASCEQQAGVGDTDDSPRLKTFSSAGELGAYLASRPANTADKPYEAALKGIDLSKAGAMAQIFAAFNGRYVDLDLSECGGASIPDPGTGARPGEELLTAVIVPKSIESIGDYAFAYCAALKKVTFHTKAALKSVGAYAFADCAALETLAHGDSVNNQETFGLPDSVETIGSYAFKNCAALASVTLPASLTKMGSGVFDDCAALTECRVNALAPPAGLASAPFARAAKQPPALVFSTVTGFLEFKKNPVWSVYEDKMTVEGIPPSMVGGMEIYFDTGTRRTDAASPPTPSCAVAAGTTLVLAPVKWNVPAGATLAWAVDGAAVTAADVTGNGEYFSFSKPARDNPYLVSCTVTAGGETKSASINVTCVSGAAAARAVTAASKPNAQSCFGFSPAAGQFTGVYPAAKSALHPDALPNEASATSEEEWRQKSETRLKEGAGSIPMGSPKSNFYDGWSLQHMGYIIAGFDHSIVNKGANGGELRIPGNDFGGQKEPGIISVMQDVNGNGLPDDVWYELKGSLHTTANGWSANEVPRYAKTYFRPANPATNPSWIDNRGNAGVADGPYPFFTNSAYVTYSGTALINDSALSTASKYVDAGTILTFNIADAVQADGSPANLPHIDFVRVHSARGGDGGGGTGSYSTELSAIQDNSLVPPPVLTGIANGAQYAYEFKNSSGYPLEIKVWQTENGFIKAGTPVLETFTLPAGTPDNPGTANKTYDYGKVALEYAGGNVGHSVTGNTVVFTATGGDGEQL